MMMMNETELKTKKIITKVANVFLLLSFFFLLIMSKKFRTKKNLKDLKSFFFFSF